MIIALFVAVIVIALILIDDVDAKIKKHTAEEKGMCFCHNFQTADVQ